MQKYLSKKLTAIIGLAITFMLCVSMLIVQSFSAKAANVTYNGYTFQNVGIETWTVSGDGTTMSSANTGYQANMLVTANTGYTTVTVSADKALVAGDTYSVGITPWRANDDTGRNVTFHVKWYAQGYSSANANHTGVWEVAFEEYNGTGSTFDSRWYDNDNGSIGTLNPTDTAKFEVYRETGATQDTYTLYINGTLAHTKTSTLSLNDTGVCGFYTHTRLVTDGAGASPLTATVSDFATVMPSKTFNMNGYTFGSPFGTNTDSGWEADGTNGIKSASTDYQGNILTTTVDTSGKFYYKVVATTDQAVASGDMYVFGVIPFRSKTDGKQVAFHVKWYNGHEGSSHLGVWEVSFEAFDGTKSTWFSWWFNGQTTGVGAVQPTSSVVLEVCRFPRATTSQDDYAIIINGNYVGMQSVAFSCGINDAYAGFYSSTRKDGVEAAGSTPLTTTVSDFATSKTAPYNTPTLTFNGSIPGEGRVGQAITLPGGTINNKFAEESTFLLGQELASSNISVNVGGTAVTVTDFTFTPTTTGSYEVKYSGTDWWGGAFSKSFWINVREYDTVTFNANGGSGSMDPQYVRKTQLDGETATVTLNGNQFTRTGYTFSGWSTTANGAKAYDDSAQYPINQGDVTLYAIWTAATYTVTVQINNSNLGQVSTTNVTGVAHGTAISVSGNVLTLGSATVTATAKTVAGYNVTFSGFTPSSGTITSNTTITANFTAVEKTSYSITFNSNGGSGTMNSQSILEGATANLTTNAFTKAGHKFVGWATTADGAKAYDDGASYTMGSANVTLYAIWEVETYTVTISVNDDALGQVSQTSVANVPYGATFSVSGNVLTVNGTQITATAKTVAGASVNFDGFTPASGTITTATTITANFSSVAIKHNIIFKANGGVGNDYTQSINEGADANLTANTFTKEGYTFLGWSADSTATLPTYVDGASYTMGTADVTLYAIWDVEKYVVTYNYNGANGGDTTVSNDVEYGFTLSTGILPVPTKTGYTFGGWWVDQACETTQVGVTLTSMPDCGADSAVVNVYAKWTVKTFTVNFETNGGNAISAQQVAYGTDLSTDMPTTTKTGYAFGGWWGDVDCELYEIGTGDYATMPDIDELGLGTSVTVYAKWTIKVYNVTFVVDGGSAVQSMQVPYGTDLTSGLPTTTKTGYTFGGWWTNDACDQYQIGVGAFATMPDLAQYGINGLEVSVYAKWTAITYKVAFEGSGADGSMAVQTITYDVETALSANQFQFTNKYFAGWALTSGATEAVYKNSALVKNLCDTQDEQITLYAVWSVEIQQYSIVYNGNGATSGTMTSEEYNAGTSGITLTANVYERTNYTFLGWATTADGEVVYADGATVSIGEADLNLYAVWQQNTATVTITVADSKYGSVSSTTLTVAVGTAFSTSENVLTIGEETVTATAKTVKGYTVTFGAWSCATAGTVTADMTITATFDAVGVDYKVAFDANGGSGTMEKQSFVYGTAKKLTANEFAREGYTFLGWATTDDATEAKYTDKQSVKDLCDEADGEITLYAVWEENGTSGGGDEGKGGGGCGGQINGTLAILSGLIAVAGTALFIKKSAKKPE